MKQDHLRFHINEVDDNSVRKMILRTSSAKRSYTSSMFNVELMIRPISAMMASISLAGLRGELHKERLRCNHEPSSRRGTEIPRIHMVRRGKPCDDL